MLGYTATLTQCTHTRQKTSIQVAIIDHWSYSPCVCTKVKHIHTTLYDACMLSYTYNIYSLQRRIHERSHIVYTTCIDTCRQACTYTGTWLDPHFLETSTHKHTHTQSTLPTQPHKHTHTQAWVHVDTTTTINNTHSVPASCCYINNLLAWIFIWKGYRKVHTYWLALTRL